jgi:hypothetical protein
MFITYFIIIRLQTQISTLKTKVMAPQKTKNKTKNITENEITEKSMNISVSNVLETNNTGFSILTKQC